MPLRGSRSTIAAPLQRRLARARSLIVASWNRPLEAHAARQVSAGRHGNRALAAVVRHAELERLRQVIDAALREGSPRIPDKSDGSDESSSPRLPTDPSGLPSGSLAADAAFAQAVLMASYATATAAAALAKTSPQASRRIVRAGIDRLVRERRAELTWELICMRPDVRVRHESLASVIALGTGPADLASLVEDAAQFLPWLRGRNLVTVVALAAAEAGHRALNVGKYAEASAWFTRAIAVKPTPNAMSWGARAAVMAGDVNGASVLIDHAFARRDPPELAWRVKARLQELTGEEDQAIQSWLEVATSPASTEPDLIATYESLSRLGDLEGKAAVAAKLVDLSRGKPDAIARHAVALWERGATSRAELMVDERLTADDAPTLRASALYLGRTGRSPGAYEVLSKMSILTRGPEAIAELIRGLRRDGHHRLADQARERALEVFSDGVSAHRVRSATDPLW